MNSIMTARPSVGAYKCDAMTSDEIDAHHDADRIWATILDMQDDFEKVIGHVEGMLMESESIITDLRVKLALAHEDIERAELRAKSECAKDLRAILYDADIKSSVIKLIREWSK